MEGSAFGGLQGGPYAGGSFGPTSGGARRQAQQYGAAPTSNLSGTGKAGYQQPPKKRIRIIAVMVCFFAPCLTFVLTAAALSFSIHHSAAAFAWLIVLLCAIAVLGTGIKAAMVARQRVAGDATREPFWYIFLFGTTAVAFGFGVYLGMMNYGNNTVPYYELQNLSVHPSVDPATTPGRQVMDVGRITFTTNSRLDVDKAIGFKNVNQYCVAPIVSGNEPMESYDYWAVGLNCCTGSAVDYHCGEYKNPAAHAGLRLVLEDQRAFYRLAVQQAEAAYNIKALHPLFFYWLEDPAVELASYRQDAQKYYGIGVLSFCMCQLLLVVVGVVAYPKL